MELELGIAIWSRKKFSIQKFLQIKLNVYLLAVLLTQMINLPILALKQETSWKFPLNAIYIKELVLLKSCSLKVL
jgi:hypothetical protein